MVLEVIRNINGRLRALRLPLLLLMNNVEVSKSELDRVLLENQIERDWYRLAPPFESLAQIMAAYATKRLVAVAPTANYQPILRLRNPKLAESYPGYLTAEAKQLLDQIGDAWRQVANAAGIDPTIKLAVTSLVRTKPYQDTIVKAGKLAAPDSPHTRGEAFDIDGSGYYEGDIAINARAAVQDKFHAAFKELGAEQPKPQYGDYQTYNPQVHRLLQEVLEQLAAAGQLHFVQEYAGTTNACFHICRNPQA